MLVLVQEPTPPVVGVQYVWPSGQARVAGWQNSKAGPLSVPWQISPVLQQAPLQITPLAQVTQLPPEHIWLLEQVTPHVPQA